MSSPQDQIDIDERNQIVMDFYPRICALAHRLGRPPRILAEDLIQQGVVAALQQLPYYDPSRGNLDAFLHFRVWKWMLIFINRELRFYNRWVPGSPDAFNAKVADDPPEVILSCLAAEDREITERYFGLGREAETMPEIASSMGVTRGRIHQRIKRSLKRLLDKLAA